jgi:hypothetical protein
LQVEDVTELLNSCLTSTYFHFEDKFYQHKDTVAVGNSSPVVTAILIFMKNFEEIALDKEEHKPAKWLIYVDDTTMVWPHGPAELQQFLCRFNSLNPTTIFTAEVEGNVTLPILDILVMKRGRNLVHKIVPETYAYRTLSTIQVQTSPSREKRSHS